MSKKPSSGNVRTTTKSAGSKQARDASHAHVDRTPDIIGESEDVSGTGASARRPRQRRSDVEIPSRERIIGHLRDYGLPMQPSDLATALGVGERESEAFAGRLAAMERDGQLMTNRKGQLCVVAKMDVVTGTVQGHPDGFGFLVLDAGGPDFFLSPREMHKALHGDRVTARQAGVDRRGRPEGAIVDVLERANRT